MERMDRTTRCLVLAMPLGFLTHDIGEVRGNAELNDALARLASGSRPGCTAAATSTSPRRRGAPG